MDMCTNVINLQGQWSRSGAKIDIRNDETLLMFIVTLFQTQL